MAWDKIKIIRDNGEEVEAQAPIIISASRSTDIPAFYADWFFKRLEIGYSAWTNPFNGVQSYVSYKNTRFIVFWSKNPRPLIPYLNILKQKRINCYIQFTLNDYEDEHLERGVPNLCERIDTFKELVRILGKGHVVWRFDPFILTDKITVEDLLRKVQRIGDALKGHTEKLVFSFADISEYKKVKTNLEINNIHYQVFSETTMHQMASGLAELNKNWNYELATCGEKIDLNQYGIKHNHCVDDTLIAKLAYNDATLMKFLGIEIQPLPLFPTENAIKISENLCAVKKKNNKDKGQRLNCGCILSKDIGQYNTCPHLCEYCYANSTKDIAVDNWKKHKSNPFNENILGK